MFMKIGPADEDRKQEYEYEGNKFILRARDPYGFVTATHVKNGQQLNEVFTDFESAKKGVRLYVQKILETKKAK